MIFLKKNNDFTLILLFWSVLFWCVLSVQNAVAQTKINIPCIGPPSTQKLVCPVGLRKCQDVLKETIQNLDKKMQYKIDFYYQGIQVDFTKPEVSSGIPAGAKVEKPICNLSEDEIDQNHLKETCGQFARIGWGGLDFTGGYGSRESSYRKGAWVAALKCYHREVKKELQEGSLSVSPICEPLALDLKKLYQKSEGISEKLGEKLCKQANIQGIDFCKNKFEASLESFQGELGKQTQSACYLASARVNIEGAFSHLSFCEMLARANQAYYQVFESEEGEKKFFDGARSVFQNCARRAKSCWKKLFKSKIKRCVIRKITACYHETFPGWMKNFIETYFPKEGVCVKPNFAS